MKTDQLEGREGRRIMNTTHKSTISLDAQDCKKLKWKGRPRSQSKQSGSQNPDSWESKLTDTSSYVCAHSRRKDVINNLGDGANPNVKEHNPQMRQHKTNNKHT